MAQSAITADVHQSLDIYLHLFSKITLDHSLLIDYGADAIDFFLRQFANSTANIDPSFFEYLVGSGTPDSVDVCQPYFYSLIGWKVYACDTCHYSSTNLSPLTLLVFGVGADDPHHSTSVNDFAFVTNFFN